VITVGGVGSRLTRRSLAIPIATALTLIVYWPEVVQLLGKVDQALNGIFDTSVPAYPMVGLFFFLFFVLMNWRKFIKRLEEDQERQPVLRGFAVVIGLLPLAYKLALPDQALASGNVFAAVALASAGAGFLVAMRPAVARFLAPYYAIFVAAVVSVNLVQEYVGGSLSDIEAVVVSGMTRLTGLPVSWSGTYLAFTSLAGIRISLLITEACSGLASTSIFLLLLGFMHFDLKPSATTTAKFAVAGFLSLVIINALRAYALIAGGFFYGPGMLWNLHGWVGYIFYIAFYFVVAAYYSRAAAPAAILAATQRPSV